MISVLRQLAANLNAGDLNIPVPQGGASGALGNILNVVYSSAGVLAVIVIIYGAYIYVTSDGNASNVKRGKDAILGASIGIVVIIMAFTITQFILGKF